MMAAASAQPAVGSNPVLAAMTSRALGAERTAALRHARRVTGQVAGLTAMIANDTPFTELAQQLLAARGSLDSLLVRLVALELRDCVPELEARHEVGELLRAALGRGAAKAARAAD